jgi:hypothetical protein
MNNKVNKAVKAFQDAIAAQEKFDAAINELNDAEEQTFLRLTGANKKPTIEAKKSNGGKTE